MTAADLFLLLPQIILVITGIAIMLLEPFTPPERKGRLGQIAVVGAAIAAYALFFQWGSQPRTVVLRMFLVDNFSIFFQWLFLIIASIVSLISNRFNERESIQRGEYYSLVLFATTGMSLMAASNDLILTFLGIEILSISTYVLAGFKRTDARANESSLKYFLLGSFATAFLLYGIALLYGSAGSTSYETIRQVGMLRAAPQAITILGLALVLVGFGFKVALVPFHAWAPDVYEGAPTPVTAFMTVGPKAAGFAALLRLLVEALPALGNQAWIPILWILSILTMTVGNVVALRQSNIKRMLAYSAIAHAGYILVGFVAGAEAGFGAVLFYLVVYSIMNLGALSVVLSLSRRGDSRVFLDDYAGLGRRMPLLAGCLALFLISLAGFPPTGGFLGKFYLFGAAVQKGHVGLAIIGVLNSLISVYYYFRVIVIMYMREAEAEEEPGVDRQMVAVIALAALLVLWLGVFPGKVVSLVGNSVLALKGL